MAQSVFPTKNDQDKVFTEYEKLIGKENAEKLHQFFSPTRIPRGLTKKQAMICVNLLPIRKAALDKMREQARGIAAKINPRYQTLPDQFVYRQRPISEEDFIYGIYKFLEQATQATSDLME